MALGHPKGLFPLFFIEMWERLAFYTMLGILLLYTTDYERGGLGLPRAEGNEIYGLYLAFVYFTPFLGGMIADRFFGYRKSVVLGGLLMSGGLFLMGIPGFSFFVCGLVCLIVGNGFFKPNISVMVGNLYQAGDPKRDAGFNIFYMGINIGAFVANYLSAYVRNEYGWLWTYWVAGAGLLIGLTILFFNWNNLENADRQPEIDPEDTGFKDVLIKILAPAFGVGILAAILYGELVPDGPLRPPVVGFLAGMVPVIVFFVRLGLTARPEEKPGLLSLLPIYLAGGTFFMILHLNGSAMTQWARDNTSRDMAIAPDAFEQDALPNYYPNAREEIPRPDPRSLLALEDERLVRMYGQQRMDEQAVREIVEKASGEVTAREFPKDEPDDLSEREEKIFDRAVKVYPPGTVEVGEDVDHGQKVVTVEVQDGVSHEKRVAFVRTVTYNDSGPEEIGVFLVTEDQFREIYEGYRERFGHDPPLLPPGDFLPVVNSEIYQSLNPLFVVAFTPLVVWFFGWMLQRGRQVSTARKVFIGLCLTTASLLIMAVAGFLSDNGTAKVSALWLVGFYAIITLGELCLSPMGLSLVTKLTPKRLVGLAMGGWFMATAFGNNLSGFFGGIQGAMEPASFFLVLAGLAALAALIIFVLLPKLDAALKKYGA